MQQRLRMPTQRAGRAAAQKRVMGGEHYEPLIAGPIANVSTDHHRRLSQQQPSMETVPTLTCFSFYAAIMYIGLDLFWSLSRKIVG